MRGDKVENLTELFEEHSRDVAKKKSSKIALALVKDKDGDFAIVEVEGGGRCQVLGFIPNEELAAEFARVINIIGSSDCDVSFDSSDEIEKTLLDGIGDLFE